MGVSMVQTTFDWAPKSLLEIREELICLPVKNASLAQELISAETRSSGDCLDADIVDHSVDSQTDRLCFQRRILGEKLVSGWKLQLGETGRATLKRLISYQMQCDPIVKRHVLGISRLKVATIEQLVVLSSVAGCLSQALKIAQKYESDRNSKTKGGEENIIGLSTTKARGRTATTTVTDNQKIVKVKRNGGRPTESSSSSVTAKTGSERVLRCKRSLPLHYRNFDMPMEFTRRQRKEEDEKPSSEEIAKIVKDAYEENFGLKRHHKRMKESKSCLQGGATTETGASTEATSCGSSPGGTPRSVASSHGSSSEIVRYYKKGFLSSSQHNNMSENCNAINCYNNNDTPVYGDNNHNHNHCCPYYYHHQDDESLLLTGGDEYRSSSSDNDENRCYLSSTNDSISNDDHVSVDCLGEALWGRNVRYFQRVAIKQKKTQIAETNIKKHTQNAKEMACFKFTPDGSIPQQALTGSFQFEMDLTPQHEELCAGIYGSHSPVVDYYYGSVNQKSFISSSSSSSCFTSDPADSTTTKPKRQTDDGITSHLVTRGKVSLPLSICLAMQSCKSM